MITVTNALYCFCNEDLVIQKNNKKKKSVEV